MNDTINPIMILMRNPRLLFMDYLSINQIKYGFNMGWQIAT